MNNILTKQCTGQSILHDVANQTIRNCFSQKRREGQTVGNDTHHWDVMEIVLQHNCVLGLLLDLIPIFVNAASLASVRFISLIVAFAISSGVSSAVRSKYSHLVFFALPIALASQCA